MLIRRFDQALFFSRMSDMICAIYKAATTAAKGKEKSIPKMFELMYSTTKWHHQHQRACLCLSHYIFCCVSIQRDTAREEETRWYYCEMIFLASSFNQTQTIFFLLAFLFLLASLAVSSRRHYTRALSQLRIIILSCKKKAQSRVKLPSNPTDNKNNCTQHRGMKSSIFFLSLQYMSAAAKQHRAGEIDNSGSMCLWKSYWGKKRDNNVSRKNFFTDGFSVHIVSIYFIHSASQTHSLCIIDSETPHNFPHILFIPTTSMKWSCLLSLPNERVYQSQLNLIKM